MTSSQPINVVDPFVANRWHWWVSRLVPRSFRVRVFLDWYENRDPETFELMSDTHYTLTIGGVPVDPFDSNVTEHLRPVSYEEWLTCAAEPVVETSDPPRGILATLGQRQVVYGPANETVREHESTGA